MGAIELVEKSQLAERPAMKSGDTVRVHVKVREGDKERIQIFEGVVIGLHRGGTRASFTVRKVSFGQGVERIFPLHSPTIQKVEVMRSAKVRRAKLYYLRDLKGKAARMKDTAKAQTASLESRLRRQCPRMTVAFPPCARSRTRCAASASCTSPAATKSGRGCLAGPVVAAAVVLSRPHIPASAIRSCAGARARAPVRANPDARRRLGGRRRRSRAKSTASTSTRPRCARCSAPCSRWPRCPISFLWTPFASPICRWRSAASARRPPLLRHCGGVDRREGHARPADARSARPGPALRLRSAQRLRHGRPLDAVARFGYSDVHRRSFRPPTLFDTIELRDLTEVDCAD